MNVAVLIVAILIQHRKVNKVKIIELAHFFIIWSRFFNSESFKYKNIFVFLISMTHCQEHSFFYEKIILFILGITHFKYQNQYNCELIKKSSDSWVRNEKNS